MTTLVAPSAVSTDVDTAEAVQAADQWLEALGGAPVRIANALKASHPCDAYDLAVTIADPYWNLATITDDGLVDLAQWLVEEKDINGVNAATHEMCTALIEVLTKRRTDQSRF